MNRRQFLGAIVGGVWMARDTIASIDPLMLRRLRNAYSTSYVDPGTPEWAWWQFAASGTFLADSSGNSRTLANSGSAYNAISGGSAYHSTHTVRLYYSGNFNALSNFTVFTRVYENLAEAGATYHFPFAQGYAGFGGEWLMYNRTNGNHIFAVDNSGAQQNLAVWVDTTGGWVDYAYSHAVTGHKYNLWRNGKKILTDSVFTRANASSYVSVGCCGQAGWTYALDKGYISDVRVYSRILEQAEINWLHSFAGK